MMVRKKKWWAAMAFCTLLTSIILLKKYSLKYFRLCGSICPNKVLWFSLFGIIVILLGEEVVDTLNLIGKQ